MPARSVPDTVTLTSVETEEETVQVYAHIAEELVELIAALVTSEPILMVGVAVMASEKVAVTTTLSPLLTVVPETMSVKTTVGEVVSTT